MQIAVCGDLHLGRSLYGFDLSPYIRRCMWDFFDFCAKLKVDAAVQLGDVFDRPTPTEEQRKVVSQWCNEFDRAGIPLFILTGNHDTMSRQESPSALQYLKTGSGQSNPWVIDRPLVLYPGYDPVTDGRHVNLLFLPFPSSGIYDTPQEYFDDAKSAVSDADEEYPTLAFAHLNVEGAKMGKQEFVYRGADFSLPKLDSVHHYFCGHVHKPQSVNGNVEVIGAADRLRFDEVNQTRLFGLVEVTDKWKLGNRRNHEMPPVYSFRRYIRPNAINLVELEIDASGLNRPDRAPTTDDVIADIGDVDIDRAIVKIKPFVDQHTMVDWSQVQAWLYSDGAAHVHLASSTRVKTEKKERQMVVVRDPEAAAKGFIGEKVGDKDERNKLMVLFVDKLKEV